jgi:hypothetical protein
MARNLANGVLLDKKQETALRARTSNKETKENHHGLNARSSLLARVISNGLAKPRPKYNAKKEKNRLAILGARYEFMNRSEIPYVQLMDTAVGSALICVVRSQLHNQAVILGGIKPE